MTTLRDGEPTEPTVELLAAEIATLKAEIAVLKSGQRHEAPPPSHDANETNEVDVRTDRRGLFKVGGAAAVAAVGTAVGTGLLSATPAAANNGDSLLLGESNTASATTEVTTSSGTGLYGVSEAASEYALSNAGVWGDSNTVCGVVGTTTAAGGYTAGVLGFSNAKGGIGVWGLDNSTDGGGYAVYATSIQGAGVVAGGAVPLILLPSNNVGPPTSGTFRAGGFYVDNLGVLYYCVSGGTPGTWVKQSPFVPLGPSRAYDSQTDGPLSAGQTRNVSLTSAGFPAGASVALVNITIFETAGLGFLTLFAQGASQPTVTNISWSASGQAVCNNATTNVGPTGEITVAAGGLGSTQFEIDVFGFYH
jgi:hypothetical protein